MKRVLGVVSEIITEEHILQISQIASQYGFHVQHYNNSMEAMGCASDFEIIFGNCTVDLIRSAKNLKWHRCVSAGTNRYSEKGLYRCSDSILSSSSGAFGKDIAEHITMVTLMLLRNMPQYMVLMRQGGWGSPQEIRTISGSTITILGTGDIGLAFAQRAKAMGAKSVCGIYRSRKPNDRCFDMAYPVSHLDHLLPQTDILVLCLPSTVETCGILSKERINLLSKTSYVINVGRGTAIDQEALIDALNGDRLAGAALDVMLPEPLPAGDKLRSAKNIILTPHIAGNIAHSATRDLIVKLFCEDFINYVEGKQLKRAVNREKGY
ncbi:MAG: D-2-hydroxyacid dehydrogenase [Puniceicoccales bacterium]|jgi:phosphoglycerate dehydrogenase-like enzyme|nr:D-2-hydroxyacid dehydrogenase [Puniceicoccales bacterium]